MVNYDSDQALTTNKGEILNLRILQQRDDVLNIMEKWISNSVSNSSGTKTQETAFRSSLYKLFKELENPLTKKFKEDKTKSIDKLQNLGRIKIEFSDEELIEAFDIINKFLYDINLTKIDTKNNFDSRNVEDENEEKGL